MSDRCSSSSDVDIGEGIAAGHSERDRSLVAAIRIVPGSIADYLAMAHWHYREQRPTSIAQVLVARLDPPHSSRPTRLGVLVVTMPTLNGRWRRYAWPGRYTTADKAADVRRLNREVRALARAIIDPRARALGLATRLVRTYLDHPLTPATEAAAAMGAFSSFLVTAGMTEYRLPPTPAQARFNDFLDSLGVTCEAALACVHMRRSLARCASVRAEIEHLHRNAGGRRFDASLDDAGQLAEACLYAQGTRTAYAHTHTHTHTRGPLAQGPSEGGMKP